MINSMRTLVTATAVVTSFALALAADPPEQKPAGASSMTKGVATVTDADGHPINLGRSAATPNALGMAEKDAMVQRGHGWWPYASSMPPYNEARKRVETMGEDEIVVNATAAISTHNVVASLANAPRELLLKPGSQLASREGFYLVKIAGFSRTQEQIDALARAGAVLGEYLNINTYIAKIPSSSFASVKALPFVTFVDDYHPAYKISPRIGLEEIPESEAVDAGTGQLKPWVFEVVLHKGVYVNDVLKELSQLRIFPDESDIVSNDALTVILVRTTPEAVPAMAQIPGIKWIAEKSYAHLQASAANPATIPMVLQNNGVYTTTTGTGWKLWNAGIDGTASGQIVTVMDSGLNTKMEHFAQDTLNNGTLGPAHRKVVGYDNYGGDLCILDASTGDGGHGAITSQHALGSISNMTANPDTTHVPNVNWDDGIARGAKLYFQDIGTAAGTLNAPLDLGPSVTAAIGKGSYVQNHSWSAATNSYDTEASNLDTALFNNPLFLTTASAGNRGAAGTGTLGSPSTAKNGLSVGGNDVANPDRLFIDCNWDGTAACASSDLGSSRGPVSGAGRIKPDIMGYVASSAVVGGEIMAADDPSAMCQSDVTKTVYWNYVNVHAYGGTSFSAPQVAGLAAVTRDYFQQGFYPTGVATPTNSITPYGSLVKAVILASGEAMGTTASPQSSIAINPRYSADVGYGRANLPGALHIGAGAPFLWVQNNDTLGQGSTKSFFYNINGNTTPLRVMMVYYDAAGDALQKDADLKVTIGANTYWGNNFSGSWTTSATSTRDHTNNTEGVFLDAAHGLPASGQIQVDVIGFNDPGGMTYSLVVVGDVASSAVTQVSLNKGQYTCNDTVKVTVNDAAGTSPVSVTLVSKNSVSATIDTQVVSCTGSNGVFVGTIQTGSGIIVADGGSITATYAGAIATATSAVSCQVAATDSGFQIAGGCDNASAGTDTISGPLTSSGSNEYYNKYMDAGEYNSYTFRFKNTTGVALGDVYVNLSFSGAGAAKMSVFNNPVHVGFVPIDGTAGGVFQVFTDGTTSPLTAVNMDFDLTSASDGYTAPKRITQVQYLQANDQVTRQNACSTFNTALTPFAESTAVTGRLTNTWRWSGSATTPTTVSSEVRTDGTCNSSVPNAAAMTGNTGAGNFVNNADSFLAINFQPALRGNGPSGRPYHYVWKWHSFYHASEAGGNQGGVWGSFYNDQWNTVTAPTGDQLKAFPISLAYYYHTIFDYPSGGAGTWNWETANTGTPDDPHFNPNTGGAPNQLIITFNEATTGLATSTTRFSYGHEHADVFWFNGQTSHGTHTDIALDNDRLVYDEYYTNGQVPASCGGGGQVGQVAFDLMTYTSCPNGTATLSVVDADGVSGMQVTVTSPGTGDSELVTLTGSAPYFSGTVNFSTNSGVGANSGLLFVLPNETISATYTDASPAGSSTATASTACAGGEVVYVSSAQFSDNGDNDAIADNNETVTLNLTIKNNLTTNLTNAKVKIYSVSPNIDCIGDGQALYGTVAAGATATNPPGDRFQFHVKSSVACSDAINPPTAQFVVVITGDGLDGSSSLQSFNVSLDLDPTASGGTYNYSQSFTADPGWTTGASPDDTGACGPYSNSFHWCAACGNGSGGYGAWTGNAAFGTVGQNYPSLDSSTLYSPVFVANGNVGLQFSIAYRTEVSYDGAIAQYSLNAGAWTDLAFTTPAQAATTSSEFCSPLLANETAWTGTATGTTWTATNTATVPSSVNQSIQFRWRFGTDSSVVGSNYGGLGVDDVSISNLKATVTCEPTRNSGLPGCNSCEGQPDGTPCNDGNLCTWEDTCQGGICSPGEAGCGPPDRCHDPGVCNPATGICSYAVQPNGTSCDDGNSCTGSDSCQAGECAGLPNSNACDDGNECTQNDVCSAGVCSGTPLPAPGEIPLVSFGANKQTLFWSTTPGADSYDLLLGLISALPVGPGGNDEQCMKGLTGTSTTVASVPSPGQGFFYLIRGVNSCSVGGYGSQGVHGVPTTPRTTTTCEGGIVHPAPGSVICGDTELVGSDPDPARPIEDSTVTWEYSLNGTLYNPIPVSPLPRLSRGLRGGTTYWNTSSLPSGPVFVRLSTTAGTGTRTWIESYVLNKPPLDGPIHASYNSGNTTLSAPGVTDPDGSIVSYQWFLGDGTTASGPFVTHPYTTGEYILYLQTTDNTGCQLLSTVSYANPPVLANADLVVVDYCDPLSLKINKIIEGNSSNNWPADANDGMPKGKQPLGWINNAQLAVAFNFEVVATVLGNPARCVELQNVRATRQVELSNGNRLIWKSPTVGGVGGVLQDDDDGVYDKPSTWKTHTPNANGTAQVAWIDDPRVYRVEKFGGGFDPNAVPPVTVAKARIEFEMLDELDGQEAPIPHVEAGGPGESAWVKFKACACWNAGATLATYTPVAQDQPDAAANAAGPAATVSGWGADPAGGAFPGCP